MKEIVTVFTILILIFGSSYLTSKYLEDTVNELMEDIEGFEREVIIAKETENRDIIIKQAKQIKTKWDGIEKGWGLIVLHSELDNIKSSICKLNANAEYGEFADCIEEAQKLKFLVGHIKEKEKFSLINIF